jgi:hypothetical protein
MKRIQTIGWLLAGLLLSAPAWAHHAAEGIISDEVWQRIDDQLSGVDSPHLNIDFEDVMGTMRVASDENGGQYLVSYTVAYVEEVDDYMAYIDLVLLEALADTTRAPSGRTVSERAAAIFFRTEDLGNGLVEIRLFEPIGNGQSQVPPPDAAPAPGKRPNG